MTSQPIVIDKEYLVALFNRVFERGSRMVEVRSPLLDSPLLRVDADFRIASCVTREDYVRGRDSRVGADSAARQEMPTWADFAETLQASGALLPGNWDRFQSWLGELEEDLGRPDKTVAPLALAIDTNVLYLRLFSRFLDKRRRLGGRFTVLISEGVRDEIDSRIRGKASAEVLRHLYSSPHLEPFLAQLGGQNDLQTRKGKLAQNELDHIRKEHPSLFVPCGPHTGDREASDHEIAKSYALFSRERGLATYMVTFDQNMGDHAKNAGLSRFLLEVPRLEGAKDASLEYALPELVHDLAVIFGVVTLHPFAIRVWGEWHGKTSADYEAERVRIELGQGNPIEASFERDLRLGRALMEAMKAVEMIKGHRG